MSDEEITSEDLEQALIEDAADGIESVVVDGMSVRKHSLKDRLAVADRQKNTTAAALPHFGMRFTKLIPPGAGGS